MARMRVISRGEAPDKAVEDITHNFRVLANHGIDLPDDATEAQVREALRKLLRLLGLRD